MTKIYLMSKANGEVKSESEWISNWHYRDLDDDRGFDEFWEDQQLVPVVELAHTTKSGKMVKKFTVKE